MPRLVLVAAPAGFGKTTLLAQSLASSSPVRVAWLSLDDVDSDPSRFLGNVAAALRDLGVDLLSLRVTQWPQPSRT